MNVKLPFAIRENQLVHISELSENERGLKCNCICPSCNKKMIAKMGKSNVHHFAHYNKKCEKAIETLLHIFAKDVLNKYKKIRIPSITLEYRQDYTKSSDFSLLDKMSLNKLCKKIVEEQIVEFDEVKLEKRFNDIIPDVVLYKSGYPLIIEIAVTHFVNDNKQRKIQQNGISTIEIDMSKFDFYNYNKNELEEFIIYDLRCKKWIYNRKLEKEKEKIISNNLKLLKKRNYERFSKINRIKNNFKKENYIKKLKVYASDIYKNQLWLSISKRLNISLNSMPIFLDMKVIGELSFECDRRIWQSYIFEKFIINEKNEIIKPPEILCWIKEKSDLPLNKDLIYTKSLNEVKVPDLNDCVLNYLHDLEKYKVIKRVGKKIGYYSEFQRIYNPLKKDKTYRDNDSSLELNKIINLVKFRNYQYNHGNLEEIIEQYAECRICNKFTNDWIIYYGDETCKCRNCNADN